MRARSLDLPALELRGHAPADVAFAARAWTLKAEQEWRSAAVFNAIVAGLLQRDAPAAVLASIARIVVDELGHTELCAEVARRLGARPPQLSIDEVRARAQAASPDGGRAALLLLLTEGAMGESISALLFHAARRSARERCARAALGLILRDESRHAHACWSALRTLLPALPAIDRDWLARELPAALGGLEQQLALPSLRKLERGERVPPELAALGAIPLELRVECFYRGLERVLLPRLHALGFDATAAWQRRYQPARSAPSL